MFSGKSCGETKAGDSAAVTATKTDGVVLATRVEVRAPEPVSVTVTGTVESVGGTCPALTLTIGSAVVKTNADTKFGGAACAAVKKGDTGGAAGVRQSDGSILATYVSLAAPK